MADNPFLATSGLYVNPESRAANWFRQTANNPTPDRWRIKTRIVDKSTALWVGPGDPAAQVRKHLTSAAVRRELLTIVAYAIPYRDLGQQSAGGAGGVSEYLAWSLALAKAIGDRPVALILEPDTLIHMPGLPENRRAERAMMLSHAVHCFRRYAPNTWVYLDGGDGRWNKAADLAPWLVRSGVLGARGFAVGVSNYHPTDQCAKHAGGLQYALSMLAGDRPEEYGFVVGASRNGAGQHDGDWCNPPGRKLGSTPMVTNAYGADALLWVKAPGESDGDCGIGKGIPSGQFSPKLALALINGT